MKIKTKLTLYVSIIVVFVFSVSILLSQFILPQYYLHQLNHHVKQALKAYEKGEKTSHIQEKYGVIITQTSLSQPLENINTTLKQQIEMNRVALNKFWVSDQILENVVRGKEVGRLYNQGEQKSNFVARFKKNKQDIIMIGASMADFAGTIQIINQFNWLLLVISISFIILLTALMARKWTKPILEMKSVTQDIGNLHFRQTNIQTKDEFEALGNSINKMSLQLENAQELLTKRNLDLKEFMTGLTHELKTPLALIKAYSSGIQDGLDDGTYLAIIIKQVEKMEKMISDMLYYAKMETSTSKKEPLDLSALVHTIIHEYEATIQKQQLTFYIDIVADCFLENVSFEKVHFILDNLISNAIKYTSEPKIFISLKENKFTISNQTELTDISSIWHPFYVAEHSRNHYFSGTGLGLSIVKSIAQQEGFTVKTDLKAKKITFSVQF